MRRHGCSSQVPVRQAMERDDEAVAVWKAEVWPDIKARRATWAPTSASRTRQARAEAAEGTHLGPARRPPRGPCPRRGRRPGQHRRGGLLPPGDRPHLFYTAGVPPPQGRAQGFHLGNYRDLIIATHRHLAAPLIWCWDNLNIHLPPSWRTSPRRIRPGCGFTGCPRTRRSLIPPRASGPCSSGSSPISPLPPGRPGPHRQTQAEEAPVPPPPHPRLPSRHRPHPRTLVTTCTTSSTFIRDNAREPGPATASFVTYGRGHAPARVAGRRFIRSNGPLFLIAHLVQQHLWLPTCRDRRAPAGLHAS